MDERTEKLSRERNEIKFGVILSYMLIVANTIYGLLITPFILNYVGDSAYGVYKSVASISASLAVMDLGLGTTMTRYMARYNATKDKDNAENFIDMVFVQFLILLAVIAVIGICILFFLPELYDNTFSATELTLARELLAILLINMVLRLFENLLFGILNGYEHFTFSNGFKLINVILKFTLILIVLPLVKDIKMVVLSETVLVTTTILIFIIYIRLRLKIVPKLKRWDNSLFKESFGYTVLMFIQSITVQFNGNVDNVLVGALQGASFVTLYSMALTIFGMYENLSGSVANIMLPKVTKQVVAGNSNSQLQASVEKAGRYQFFLLAAALGGFVCLGKDFYKLWLGDAFEDCYYLVLILIVPVTIPMIQNVALSILRAENKMVYRTVTLSVSCVCNFVITFLGIKFLGYWGAAIGTSCATLLNLLMMNIYYHKNLGFKILRMFANIIHGTLPAALIATIVTGIIHHFFNGTWLSFIVNIIVYLIVYGFSLLMFGMKEDEKSAIFGRIVRKAK